MLNIPTRMNQRMNHGLVDVLCQVLIFLNFEAFSKHNFSPYIPMDTIKITLTFGFIFTTLLLGSTGLNNDSSQLG